MSWTDSLRPASFRGVPFETLSGSYDGGRRTVVHEIPGADNAVGEDTGRRPGRFAVEAFVIGPSARAPPTALIAALNEEGPGRLVHPVHGDLDVWVDTFTQSNSWADGDAVSFAITFHELGDLDFLGTLVIGSGGLLATVDTAATALGAVFDALTTLDGFAQYVTGTAINAYTGVLDDIADVINSGLGDATEAAALAVDIRETVEGMPDAVDEATSATITDVLGRVGDLEALLQIAVTGTSQTVPTYDPNPSAAQAQRITYQARRLQSRAAVCEAARLLASTDLDDYDTAIRWRDELVRRIDVEAQLITEEDADALDPLRDLAAAITEDVGRRAARLPRTTTYTPPGSIPSVVAAWALYRDPTRGAEIATRNSVVHPGFLPVEPLQVLTS